MANPKMASEYGAGMIKKLVMIVDLSIIRRIAEFEIGSVLFVVGGVITVGIATAYWWYTIYKDRD